MNVIFIAMAVGEKTRMQMWKPTGLFAVLILVDDLQHL